MSKKRSPILELAVALVIVSQSVQAFAHKGEPRKVSGESSGTSSSSANPDNGFEEEDDIVWKKGSKKWYNITQSDGLPSNTVYDIDVHEQYIYALCYHRELTRYEIKSGRIRNYNIKNFYKPLSVFVEEGRIYVAGWSGIYSIDQDQIKGNYITFLEGTFPSRNNAFTDVIVQEGNLYAGSSMGLLVANDSGMRNFPGEWVHFTVDKKGQIYMSSSNALYVIDSGKMTLISVVGLTGEIRSLASGIDGDLYLATSVGLYVINPDQGNFKATQVPGVQGNVRALTSDDQGRIYLIHENNELLSIVRDKARDKTIITIELTLEFDIKNIRIDHSRDIYLATNNGIYTTNNTIKSKL